jgi:hypothetical protein
MNRHHDPATPEHEDGHGHQLRDHPVNCLHCGRLIAWAHNGVCDQCARFEEFCCGIGFTVLLCGLPWSQA